MGLMKKPKQTAEIKITWRCQALRTTFQETPAVRSCHIDHHLRMQ